MELPQHLIHALKASIDASYAIMHIYSADITPSYKTDGSPVTLADLASSEVLMNELSKTNIPIISEEVDKQPFSTRKKWDKVWIVDPLDGTKEFIRKNDEFVICIALVENGSSTFGILAHPVSQTLLFGGESYGAFHIPFSDIEEKDKWTALPVAPLNKPVTLSSSRTPYQSNEKALIEKLEAQFDTLQFSKKGSALKFFDLVLGKSDVYPRFAPTMEWDIAAGHAILKSIGGEVLDATTENPLVYNKESLYNPHFVAYTPALMAALEK